ncbi:MAG: hypothetical protein OXI71_01675 [Gemmatimonadota bacterium]|nr:hypothetical protein [Gemmatimonadota bacterium]MXX34695.1 hypothetical protein [Gemmatimonadota bacterium]MYD12570.1 hypothetical protein [Gemmatimonadota bacterium]
MRRRPDPLGTLALAAIAGAFGPLHAQESGSGLIREPDSPLLISREWLPVASVTMAFPASARSNREALLAQAGDAALLAALREATADQPVRVTYDRDATGRYFIATAAPEVAESVLETMRRASRTTLPTRLVDEAVSALRRDLAFRGELPRSQFDRIMDAHLRGAGGTLDGGSPVASPDSAGLAAEITTGSPASRWGPPTWVVVGNEEAFPTDESRAIPPFLVVGAPARPPEPLLTRVPSDAVTHWTGSVFRFPSQTTLLEAFFVRLLLEELLESRRDPDLFEFDTGIDALGRLVVRLSTSAEMSGSWETRLDEAILRLGSEDGGVRLDQLLPRVLSRWSRELAPAPGAGRAAAEALLRGATELQAASFANSAASLPSAERLRAVARGTTLESRVVYGGG